MSEIPIQINLPRFIMKRFTNALGFSVNPFIVIRRDYKDCEWLIAHETDHWYWQGKIGTAKWLEKYYKNKKFKLWAESRAIAVSINHGLPFEKGVLDLVNHYDFKIDLDQSRKLLKHAMKLGANYVYKD